MNKQYLQIILFLLYQIYIIQCQQQQLNEQEQIIKSVYSPFYVNKYEYNDDEGVPLMIKIVGKEQYVFIASGKGGLIILDSKGEKKLFQQKFDNEYINSYDISQDGLILILGSKLKLNIYQFNQFKLSFTSTSTQLQQYILISQISFPSEIYDLVYKENKSIVVAAGLLGYVSIYDMKNIYQPKQIGFYDTQAPQISSVYISNDFEWIYLSCDINGVVVLRILPKHKDQQDNYEYNLVLASFQYLNDKSWKIVATQDNKYIFQIKNWFGIYYANNEIVLQSKIEDYPIELNFIGYWPLTQINPICNTFVMSKDENKLFVGVRSIGILIFDITEKENIKYFQHIQIDAQATSVQLSQDENYLYFSNSLSVFTFQQSQPNLQNDYPNLFNIQQAYQTELEGMYKWRCYIDPTNQYMIGAFDYSGLYIIPYYQDPHNLLIKELTFVDILTDSVFIDQEKQLLVLSNIYSKKLISVYRIGPTKDDPSISLLNLKEVTSYYMDDRQMAEQLVFSKDQQYAIQTYQTSMLLFNVTDLFNISLISQWMSPPEIVGGETGGGAITEDNNWIIGVVRSYGIYVLDAKNKTNLILANYLETLGGESIYLSKIYPQYGYFMDGIRGFAIIDISQFPQIVILSRVTLSGWAQAGVAIKNDNFILVSCQDKGMVSLIDIKDKKNPKLISKYQREKQFAVTICSTKEDKHLFITTKKGIITLPLFSNVTIHTEVSEIEVSIMTGLKKITRYEKSSLEISLNEYIFEVGQQIQLNFVILYPQDEDMAITSVQVYHQETMSDIPYYMTFQQSSQTLIMEVNKLALGDERSDKIQNVILIKTLIPLSQSSFLYKSQHNSDYALTNDNQANLIFKYLINRNYLDSKNSILDTFDYNKQFQFDENFLQIYQQTYQPVFENIGYSEYIEMLQKKVQLTLMKSSFINPFQFYVAPSLELNFENKTQYINSKYSQLIEIYLQIQIGGKFVAREYQGVISSTSELGDQIKIEGSLDNINRVLNQQIIFYHDKTMNENDIIVQITIIDNVNYPLIVKKSLILCSFIVMKKQIEVKYPLQQQIEKQFQSSSVQIVTDLSFQFQQDTFFVSDSKTITYKIQLKTGAFKNNSTDIYEDLSPEFWMQSMSKQQLIFTGKIPSSQFNKVFQFKIIADDGYTQTEDYFYLKADLVPFFYVISFILQILGPAIALFQIYQKRSVVLNMYYKKRVIFEDEIAYIGQRYYKKIILLGNTAEDARQIVTNLIKKVNSEKIKIKNEQDECEDSIVIFPSIVSPKQTPKNIIQLHKIQSSQFLSSNNTTNQQPNTPTLPYQNGSVSKRKQKRIKSAKLHTIYTNSERKFLKKQGSINMKAVISELIDSKLVYGQNDGNNELIDYKNDLKNSKSRIHKAIKATLARYLLSLNKKSQMVYEFIKKYSIKNLNNINNENNNENNNDNNNNNNNKNNKINEREWYKSILNITPVDFQNLEETNSYDQLVLFPILNFKYDILAKILTEMKIISQDDNNNSYITTFDQLYNALILSNSGINMYLIKEVIFGEAYGFNCEKGCSSSFNVAQGESIHLHPYDIKSIQAYKRIQCKKIYQPILQFFNLEFTQYGVSKNMKLPTWITLDQKYGTILFKGVPSNFDNEEILIRICNQDDYVIKSFMIKVLPNTHQPTQESFYTIPDEDNKISNNLESFQSDIVYYKRNSRISQRNTLSLLQNSLSFKKDRSHYFKTSNIKLQTKIL